MRHTDVLGMFIPRTQEAISAFVRLIEETRSILAAGGMPSLGSWFEKFLADIGYIAELRRSEKNQETADNRVQNVKELVMDLDATGSGAQPPSERLEEFLDDIALDAEREEEKENEMDAVTLITMHSCKGLEFPHVFIVGLEEGLLPHSRSKIEGTLDEERRLFYVAITRAMQSLAMSHCLSRKKYGQALPCHPSAFLQEIPEQFVERADSKARAPVAADSGKGLFSAMRAAIG
jgi:superfamily I DNA/RNA helicase